MGEQAEYGSAMQQARKDRHREWREMNMQFLQAAGATFVERNFGEMLMFRADGKPAADFFPSTGRWRSGGRTFSGGARRFLEWLEKQ